MRISGPRDGRSHGSAYEPEPLDADEREGGIAEIRPSDVVHFMIGTINCPRTDTLGEKPSARIAAA